MHFLLTALSGLIVGAATRYPLPIPITGNYSAIQDTYFIKLTSGNLYFRFSSFDGIQTATVPSLLRAWKNVGSAFPSKTFNEPIAHWTPGVHLINGQYFMYYTQYNTSAVGGERDTILVATSPNLRPGSWTQQGDIGLPIAFSKHSRIDANLILNPPSNLSSHARGLSGTRTASAMNLICAEAVSPNFSLPQSHFPVTRVPRI